MTFPSRWLALSCFVSFAAAVVARPAAADTVVRAGFASIAHDADDRTWTIASSGGSLVLDLDAARDFALVRLSTSSGKSWIVPGLSDTFVTAAGQTATLGSRAAGFIYRDVTATARGLTVQLDATFEWPAARLRATRHYAATSGSPTFETWTTITPLAGAVTVGDLNAFKFTAAPGPIRWLNGLQGDDPNQPQEMAFTLRQRELAPGERLALGAIGRSSEETVPWFAIDGGSEQFFAGLMWSGAWSMTAVRTGNGLELALGLAPMSTSAAAAVESPHAFFGVVRGGPADAAAALRTFIVQGVRGGRSFDALATYNTWFAYGVEIDEETMRAEIDGAAALGAELFVVDAGWYVGAGRSGVSDFSSGLGTWQVDAARFPNGLGALADYARERGLQFGIWVEPERVALSTVGQRGLAQEAWLARAGGRYGATQEAQICLASAAARQWVLDQMVILIDAARPDYVKWDNNFWINCDRSGHGHGATDGNFAHVNALYDVLGSLRARYPALSIENVSGGGNRLDVGMLRFSDVGWMDDRSAPSVHVRHMVEGLSAVFPPAYLLSFVMDHPAEPIHGAADMPLYFRSRMTGVLGLCFRTGEFSEGESAVMAEEIETYKILRNSLRTASAALLTAQADPRRGPAWDVFQTTSAGERTVVLSAFQWDSAVGQTLVRPVGLRPRSTYQLRSIDTGDRGTATGAELMTDGILLIESPLSAAHILVLQRRTP
jgi:alpha-galactosidase